MTEAVTSLKAQLAAARSACMQDAESKNRPKYVQAGMQTDALVCMHVEEASQTEDTGDATKMIHMTVSPKPNSPANARRLSSTVLRTPSTKGLQTPVLVHLEASDLFQLEPCNLFHVGASGRTRGAEDCQTYAGVGAGAAAALGEDVISMVLKLDLNLADVKDATDFMKEVHADVVWAAGLDPSKVVLSHILFAVYVRFHTLLAAYICLCMCLCQR